MRSICLLLSRHSRRWLCIVAIAFTWLGMCQPAAAAVSCSASTQPAVIYYSNSAPNAAPGTLLTTVSCTGFTGSNVNQFIMCTTSDVTSSGTGGRSSGGIRTALNSAGDVVLFDLQNDDPNSLNSPGQRFANGNFGSSSNGGVLTQSTFVRAPFVFVSKIGSRPSGDYFSMVSITIDIRTSNQNGSLTSCSQGTSAGLVILSIPITIRVGGAACGINNVENINFGDISVNGLGRVSAITASASIEISCAPSIAWSVTFSDGNNVSGTGTYRRRMANGSSYLTYGFGRTSSNATTSTTLSGTSSMYAGQSNVTAGFYAFLPIQTPSSLTPGLYSDTVIITLNY